MIDLLLQYPNLIVIRMLSKFFDLAGIRIGFIFTQCKSEIIKIKSPYNVNYMACQVTINLF